MSQYPVITAGTKLTAALLNAMLPNLVEKAGSTSRASNTTVSDDPDLTFAVVAGIYRVEMHLLFSGQTSAGFKTVWTVPSGTTGNKRVQGPGSSASDSGADNIAVRHGVHGYATAVSYSNVRGGTQVHAIERARMTVTNSGNVTLQWAQMSSSATATVLGADSYIEYRRIG